MLNLNQIASPSTLPTNTGRGVYYSPDGNYLAVAHSSSPYISVYKITDGIYTKLNNPVDLPTNTGDGISFSPDGRYIAIAHSSSPYITVYLLENDILTKVDVSGGYPSNTGRACKFSNDGTLLAVGHSNAPYVTIYSVTDGVFTKTTLGDSLNVPGICYAVDFSFDDTYFAVGLSSAPYVVIYKNNGGVYEQIAATLPTALTGTVYGIAFNDVGPKVFLSAVNTKPGYIYMYEIVNDLLEERVVEGTVEGTGYGVSFGNNDKVLMVSHASTPYISLFDVDTDSGRLTEFVQERIVGSVSDTAYAAAMSDDFKMAVAHSSSPFLSLFEGEEYHLSGITIGALPRAEYTNDEVFDVSGIVVLAEYTNGNIRDVSGYIATDLETGYIFLVSDIGTKTINISYIEENIAMHSSYEITINRKPLDNQDLEVLMQKIEMQQEEITRLNDKIKSEPLPSITLYLDEADISVMWNTITDFTVGEKVLVKVYRPDTSQEIMTRTGEGRRSVNGVVSWHTSDLMIRPSAPVNMLIEMTLSTDPKQQKYYAVIQYKERTTNSEVKTIVSTHYTNGKIQGRIIS